MTLDNLDLGKYQLGWSDEEDYVFKPRKGLSEEIVREMSAMKKEPQWMLDFRLAALTRFQRKPMMAWFAAKMPDLAQWPQAADHYQSKLRNLQFCSGLTWSEMARAFGVSRRAVHHWAAGSRLSERNAQRVEKFAALVTQNQESTPDLTRRRLLTPRGDGRSPLTVFSEESQPRRTVPLSTLSVAEFLDDVQTGAPSASPSNARPSSLRAQRLPRRTE